MIHEELKDLMETSLIEHTERVLARRKRAMGFLEALGVAMRLQEELLKRLEHAVEYTDFDISVKAFIEDYLINGGG